MVLRIIHESCRDQTVHRAEHQCGGGEDGDEVGDAGVRDQPQIDHGHLPGDMREGGKDAVRDRAEPALRQVHAQREHGEAAYGACEAQEESRREEVAEQQAARHHAQQRYPCRRAPAVACQDDQRDDIGQPGFDAGQRRGDGVLQHGEAERHRCHARDVVVFGGGV